MHLDLANNQIGVFGNLMFHSKVPLWQSLPRTLYELGIYNTVALFLCILPFLIDIY